jgi:membrane fusion protein, multidrug efflux system
MNVSRVQTLIPLLISLSLPACNARSEKPRDDGPKITVTTLQSKAVTLTQRYVCRINSHQHIEVRAPQTGYLGAIPIREGQTVKKDDLLFQIRRVMDKEKLGTGKNDEVVSIRAPFDGVVGSLTCKQGSLIRKSDSLTTLSDNSLMRADFNVPEARYLEYKSAKLDQHSDELKIELESANGSKFQQTGKLGAIGAQFNAGTVAFRADFPNPDHLLRHGETGIVLISRTLKNALVIPQHSTLEALAKRYVYVVDKDDVAHQREIVIQNELDDLYVVKTGVRVDDKIVIDGVTRVHDGKKVEYEGRQPKKVVANLK